MTHPRTTNPKAFPGGTLSFTFSGPVVVPVEVEDEEDEGEGVGPVVVEVEVEDVVEEDEAEEEDAVEDEEEEDKEEVLLGPVTGGIGVLHSCRLCTSKLALMYIIREIIKLITRTNIHICCWGWVQASIWASVQARMMEQLKRRNELGETLLTWEGRREAQLEALMLFKSWAGMVPKTNPEMLVNWSTERMLTVSPAKYGTFNIININMKK